MVAARRGSGQSPEASTPVESLIAPNFWTDLSDAVAGLRDVLENPDEADQYDDDHAISSSSTSVTSPGSTTGIDGHAILLGNASASPKAQATLPPGLLNWLPSVYEDRVHPIFKPVHWPSTLAIIRPQNDGLHRTLTPNARALESAVHFTAACSLLDHEVEQRQSIVQQLRQTAEDALARAGLLTTTDLSVLQAFIIYLVSKTQVSYCWRILTCP